MQTPNHTLQICQFSQFTAILWCVSPMHLINPFAALLLHNILGINTFHRRIRAWGSPFCQNYWSPWTSMVWRCVWGWQKICMRLAETLYEAGRRCVWAWQKMCMRLAEDLYEAGRRWVWGWPKMCMRLADEAKGWQKMCMRLADEAKGWQKMCMRLADEAKYKTGTKNNHAWPDRCLIHG